MSGFNYTAPNISGSVFNPSDYNFQDDTVAYKDAVLLTNNQVIDGTKTLLDELIANDGIKVYGDIDNGTGTISSNVVDTNTLDVSTTTTIAGTLTSSSNNTWSGNNYFSTIQSNRYIGQDASFFPTITQNDGRTGVSIYWTERQ